MIQTSAELSWVMWHCSTAWIRAPSSPLFPFPPPNKGLSDTQNWPKEKRVKRDVTGKGMNVCGRRVVSRNEKPRREWERRGAAMRRNAKTREGESLSLSHDKDNGAQRGKENQGSKRRVSKMSWQWGVGYIVPRATVTDITGTDGGPELPTRDPSDEGELYMTQNTIAPLSPRPRLTALTENHPQTGFRQTARTNADTRGYLLMSAVARPVARR